MADLGHGSLQCVFPGKYVSKGHGGGGGGAHRIGCRTWALWSHKLGDAVGRPIELFRGSFNVLFDEPQEVDRLTKGSLCRYRPVLECAPLPTDEPIWRRKKRRDGKPYLFYRVGLQHGSEWRTAFLWLPSYELKSTGRQGATHNGRYDFVLERIEDAKPGDRVRVDFSPTYAAPQRSGQ